MNPDYISKDGRIKLYNADCMDYMKTLEANAFELAVVDPPYGIGDFTLTSRSERKGIKPPHRGKYSWNSETPSRDYFDLVDHISLNSVIWGANYYNCFSAKGGALVWYKNTGHKCMSQCEIASNTLYKKIDYVHINWTGGIKANSNVENIHPCQKPVKLYDWIYANYAKEGERILDTHLGSGSSAIAAHYAGLEFVGIELDPDYFQAAVKRFEQETAQSDLFGKGVA